MSVSMYGFVLELCFIVYFNWEISSSFNGIWKFSYIRLFDIYNLVYKGKGWFIDLRKAA
ncbi:MAG: hypothetical protein ACLTBU_13010 [Zhenhengia sp.]